MCGIAGFYGDKLNNNKDIILAMNQTMLHRGPDAGGFFIDETTGMTLGHRRLSIIDLTENGSQPMHSTDDRYVISYNGEIYNFEIIKNRLINDKIHINFRGSSDTEILLEACAAYGMKETLRMAKGMFAIALYDRKEKRLFLARDRVGEKPLYYGKVGGKFAFASELASLKVMPDFNNGINQEALSCYFRYGFVPTPLSIYQDIYKLEPGIILSTQFPFDQWDKEEYWSMRAAAEEGKAQSFLGTETEAAKELEQKISDSIKGQMIADVPVGAYLSGGIDSSLVVALMQNICTQQIRTFTVGFEDEKYNEADYAKEIARYVGTRHTEVYVTEQELQEVIPNIAKIYSEPFADSSQIPTYLVSKIARRDVTVALSGDAGDELFCGYNTYYKVNDLWNKIQGIPGVISKAGANISLSKIFNSNDKFNRIGHCLRAENIAQLHEAVCYDTLSKNKRLVDFTYNISKDCEDQNDNSMETMMLRDMLRYHTDDILVKVDRAGMAVSLENRVPLLDKDVIEFAFRIPMEYKYKNGVSKKILRDILYQYVPQELLNRPKKGFSVPMKKWLESGKVHEWAKDMILDSALAKDGYIIEGKNYKLWKNFLNKGENAAVVWKSAVAEQWYRSIK